ncbi:MAG: SDR family NAD(P)-dependent oxidoreductase [Pseudomonadales bacterium]
MNPTQPATRVAVVVGAAGGIGAALVDVLAARPDFSQVIALSRRPDAVPRSADATIAVDPLDRAALLAARDRVAARTPAVHRLIICIGLLHAEPGPDSPGINPEKALKQLDQSAFAHCMSVNAFAPLAVLDAFLPLLRHAEGAVAAALSARVGSIADNRLGGWYSYRMSKAALNMGIRTAAIELQRLRHGPTLVAIHPGTTATALSAPFVARRTGTGPRSSPDTSAQPDAPRSARDSAARLVAMLDGVSSDDNGALLNWDGTRLPW